MIGSIQTRSGSLRIDPRSVPAKFGGHMTNRTARRGVAPFSSIKLSRVVGGFGDTGDGLPEFPIVSIWFKMVAFDSYTQS